MLAFEELAKESRILSRTLSYLQHALDCVSITDRNFTYTSEITSGKESDSSASNP